MGRYNKPKPKPKDKRVRRRPKRVAKDAAVPQLKEDTPFYQRFRKLQHSVRIVIMMLARGKVDLSGDIYQQDEHAWGQYASAACIQQTVTNYCEILGLPLTHREGILNEVLMLLAGSTTVC